MIAVFRWAVQIQPNIKLNIFPFLSQLAHCPLLNIRKYFPVLFISVWAYKFTAQSWWIVNGVCSPSFQIFSTQNLVCKSNGYLHGISLAFYVYYSNLFASSFHCRICEYDHLMQWKNHVPIKWANPLDLLRKIFNCSDIAQWSICKSWQLCNLLIKLSKIMVIFGFYPFFTIHRTRRIFFESRTETETF